MPKSAGSPHLPLEYTSGKLKFNYEELLKAPEENLEEKVTKGIPAPADSIKLSGLIIDNPTVNGVNGRPDLVTIRV
jgi:hypothetical protein